MVRRLAALGLLAVAAACSAAAGENRIVIDPESSRQTMRGWEVSPRMWEMDKVADRYDASWLDYREEIAAALVDEIGVNRIRLQIQSGAENPVDYWARFFADDIGYEALKRHFYEKVNDNSDPGRADPGGYNFTQLDYYIDNLLMPMKARLEARGERLIVNLCYVDFKWTPLQGSLEHAGEPAEFAELIDETFRHLEAKYGLTPDYFEVILEPENTVGWDGRAIGKGLVAVNHRLSARGVRPRYIAPSTAEAGKAAAYFDALAKVPTAAALVDVLSYHRYDWSRADAALPKIAARAKKAAAETAMLEFVGGNLDHLYQDLTVADATAWQKYGVATTPDSEGKTKPGYLLDLRNGAITPKPGAAAMAQVFRNVREGAVRLDARSLTADARALAFRNADNSVAIIVIADRAGAFTIEGAPRGQYALSFAPKGGARNDLGVVASGSDGTLSVSASRPGVIALRQAAPASR